jgi:heat shock protein HslJ
MPAHRRALRLTRILPVVLLATALALTSCAPLPGSVPAAVDSPLVTPHPLVGSTWILVARRDGEMLPGSHINLTFEDTRLTGSAGCNSYFADYTVDDGQLSYGIVGNTVMACEPAELMTQERAFLEALHAGGQLLVDGDRLKLLGADGQPALIFARRAEWPPQDTAALATRGWRLTDLNGETLLPDTTITLFFDAAGATGQSRGKMRGEAGCRDYEGEYEATDRTLRFPMTSMMGEVCASTERLLQEERYTTLLGGTERYRIDGDALELGTFRGAMLRFAAIPRDATPAP